MVSRHFGFKVLFAESRHSTDSSSAKNASDAIVAVAVVVVALVSVARVLPIALVIAVHKALTKSLRGGILVFA